MWLDYNSIFQYSFTVCQLNNDNDDDDDDNNNSNNNNSNDNNNINNSIITEYLRIINLIDNRSHQPSKFRTRKRIEITDN